MFAIDTSRSMLTPDVKPDRLTRAKLAIDDFASQLDGDAVGIVAFAGAAFLVCPITLDYGAFHESLSAIDTNTIPRGGTNISSAIRAAQAALRRRPGSDKILILVTDGEDLEGRRVGCGSNSGANRTGSKSTPWVWERRAGDLIPSRRTMGGGFVKDDSGAFVKSRLDEPALKAIAAATGGIYAPLGDSGRGARCYFQDDFRLRAEARARLPAAENLYRALSMAVGGISGAAAGQPSDRQRAAAAALHEPTQSWRSLA